MPALPLTVIPGALWNDGSEATPSMLNQTANPTVLIEPESITSELLDIDDIIGSVGGALGAVNYLGWGSFHWDTFVDDVLCPPGKKTAQPAGWHTNPSDTPVMAVREQDSPNNESSHCLMVSGAGANAEVQIGTYLPPQTTGHAQGKVVFSAYIYNGTAIPFTPDLLIQTSAGEGNEGSTDPDIELLGAIECVKDNWTRVSWVIEPPSPSAVNWRKGAHVIIVIKGGAMAAGKYVKIAQAGLDRLLMSTAWIPNIAELPVFSPGMQMPWPGDAATIPNGWLFCDGRALSQLSYLRLYSVIGDKYKTSAGEGMFNIPDLRGSVIVGAEVYPAIVPPLDRTMIDKTGCTIPVMAQAILDVGAAGGTRNLHVGMGVIDADHFHPGTIITDIISDRLVAISAFAISNPAGGTVGFSKMGVDPFTGVGDPRTVGACGAGLSKPGGRILITHPNGVQATAGSDLLTVRNTRHLACGMLIDCPGVTPGTKILAFTKLTEVKMTANAEAAFGPGAASFRVDAPETGQESEYQRLLRNPTVMCDFNGGTGTTLATGIDMAHQPMNFLIRAGMKIMSSHTGFAANSWVASVSTSLPEDFTITPAPAAGAPAFDGLITFSIDGSFTTDDSPPGPRWVVQNWMIKT